MLVSDISVGFSTFVVCWYGRVCLQSDNGYTSWILYMPEKLLLLILNFQERKKLATQQNSYDMNKSLTALVSRHLPIACDFDAEEEVNEQRIFFYEFSWKFNLFKLKVRYRKLSNKWSSCEFSFLRQRNENPIYCSWWRSNNDMGMLSFLFVHERSLLSNKSKDHLIKKINARRYRFHRIVRAKKIELTTTFDAHYEMKFSNSPHFYSSFRWTAI